MIEINLAPGSSKRSSGRSKPRLAVPAGRKLEMPAFDRTAALLIGAWLAALGTIAYLHFSTGSRIATLHAEEEAAVRDSARYATLKAQGDSLAAQEAMIAQRMQLIQEIDSGRLIWAHILDELSRALPPYVWLINVADMTSESVMPRTRVEGRAGNYYAIGKYIEDLEASPFLSGVRLISSTRMIVDERVVIGFVLEFDYIEPPPDAIQTVPLFAAQTEE